MADEDAVAAELRSQRLASQRTQAWLARRLGFTQQTVHKIEAGLRPVRFAEAVRWLRATGGSLEDLADAVNDVEATSCGSCFDRPPAGFTCNACGEKGKP